MVFCYGTARDLVPFSYVTSAHSEDSLLAGALIEQLTAASEDWRIPSVLVRASGYILSV
jgi:hypothetical protein